jgi:hypothetical protein
MDRGEHGDGDGHVGRWLVGLFVGFMVVGGVGLLVWRGVRTGARVEVELRLTVGGVSVSGVFRRWAEYGVFVEMASLGFG